MPWNMSERMREQELIFAESPVTLIIGTMFSVPWKEIERMRVNLCGIYSHF